MTEPTAHEEPERSGARGGGTEARGTEPRGTEPSSTEHGDTERDETEHSGAGRGGTGHDGTGHDGKGHDGTARARTARARTEHARTEHGSAGRLARAGGRGLLGALGVAALAASVAAASWLPLPVLGHEPGYTVVTPVAATQQRICAGPILRLGEETGQEATTPVSVGTAAVTSAATMGTPRLQDMEATPNPSNTPPQRLLLEPGDGEAAAGILAGSQSQYVNDGEYVGLAASGCAQARTQQWLVGGSTITGRTTLLSLSNPSKVASTVSLAIYSEDGAVQASGTGGIIVPPGGQRVLSLAGFAPRVASPVVRVTSAGGQVAASLQESIIRTLTPGGVDTVGAVAAPTTRNVIPGVVLAGQHAIETASGIPGYQDAATILRILVPEAGTDQGTRAGSGADSGAGTDSGVGVGPEAGTAAGADGGADAGARAGTQTTEVRVTAVPEDGSAAPSTATLTVDVGAVTDIPLDDFADGSWTFTVATTSPAVAAARTTTVTFAGDAEAALESGTQPTVTATDFAWYRSAPELTGADASSGPRGTALVSVAEGPNPTLHLANTGPDEAVVTINATRGADTTVTIAAGRAVALPVAGAHSYRLGGYTSLHASVSYHGAGRLAGYPVSPPERAALPVTVYHQYG